MILVNTAAPDRPSGSMVRFAAMVRRAWTESAPGEMVVSELNLSPPNAWLHRFPRPLQTPIRYLGIAISARRQLPRQRAGILHLLDGSHAYLLDAVNTLQVPLLTTVHDLIPVLCLRGELPGPRPGRGAAWIAQRALANLHRADALVAVSENTRSDVLRLAGVDPDRVHTVHSAASEHPLPPSLSPAGSGGNAYILHVAGNNNFYKNRPGVVEVWDSIRRSVPVSLVLVGPPPDVALHQKIESTGAGEAIQIRSNVSETELVDLYRGAAFLLFPSTYEGFGWPPLEAMANGCPVICAAAGSLPEIVGTAALLAPPGDIAALAEHGLQLLRDADFRRRRVEAGRRQVELFSLEAMGKGLVQAYDRAAAAFARRAAKPSRRAE